MSSRTNTFRMDHPVIVTFLVIAVVAAMSLAAEVFKPLALAILVSFALAPLAHRIERRGASRSVAAVLTVVFTLTVLAGASFIVGKQLASLANRLPNYRENVFNKFDRLRPAGTGTWARVAKFATDVEAQIDDKTKKADPEVANVNVVSEPSYRGRLLSALGPYLEFLSVAVFVLILVLFMLLSREDLRNRITQLFGRRSITLTTRTMNDVGGRISRYLATFVAFNSAYGLVMGVGLALIGVPFATLWGFLAAAAKFIPYVGPATAFALPFLFSVAIFPGWTQPLEVVLLFGVIEIVANTFLEPVIYGRITGVSALGLLIAAVFWTWLWGMLGLLLSTPLTVCLAVLGKYVPSLSVFSTLLGEEAELGRDVRFYQRLLSVDQDGAVDLIDAARKELTRVEIFDQILVPALSRAERDNARENIDDREQEFIWKVTREIIDDLSGTPDPVNDEQASPHDANIVSGADPLRIVGFAAGDHGAHLVLRMLEQLLAPDGIEIERISDVDSPLILAETVAADPPALVLVSQLPPAGLAGVRYLVRRLRTRLPDMPIVVGRWTTRGESDAGDEKLTTAGATRAVSSLADARDRIRELLRPVPAETPAKGLLAVMKSA